MAQHHVPAPFSLRRAWLAPLLAFASLPLAAAPALAAPDPPHLLGTHPGSPGLSTTPRVFGTVGDVVATVVGSRALGGPTAAVLGQEGTIAIYADPACGSEVANGSVDEFESSGIPTTVLPGSSTSFYATFSDSTGASTCSAGITYRQVDDPPGAPILSGITPSVPGDFNFPLVLGSAEEGSTVEIFTNSGCSGAPVATGTASQLSGAGIQVAVADNTTTTFYARASWAELPSPCSSTSITYQEVTAPPPAEPQPEQPGGSSSPPPVVADPPGRPPAPKIHSEPGGRANVATPRIVGSAPGAVRVDLFRGESCDGARAATAAPAELAAGIPFPVAPNATTTISALAVDASGERSRCTPEPVVYVEDSLAPLTRITFGPGVRTRKRSPVFRFADISGDPTGTNFLCKLDRRPWQACQTPWHLSRLRPRSHLVQIRAVDTAGNQEAVGTKRRFKVISARSR